MRRHRRPSGPCGSETCADSKQANLHPSAARSPGPSDRRDLRGPALRATSGALLLALAVSAGGCTLLFDPARVTYVDDASVGTDAGPRPDAGPPRDGGPPRDAGPPPDGGPPRDGGGVDAGPPPDGGPPPSCGQLGEACCVAPSPACVPGANCTFDGCQPCGGPGEVCCDDGPACGVLTCIGATDRCPTLTPLVQVSVPAGGTYGIDAHEVTRRQYEDWLATSPTPSGPLIASGCGWNTDLTPNAACIAAGFGCTGAGCSEHPQTCIDFCDAFAYCAAVGKRLCGRYGDTALPTSTFADASASPWFNACSAGGVTTYGNGNDYGDAADFCQFTDLGSSAPAASLTSCQSTVAGYEGVIGLTGNVREWVNGCSSPTEMTAQCLAVGGSYLDNDAFEGQCNYPNTLPRNSTTASTGFRCCQL